MPRISLALLILSVGWVALARVARAEEVVVFADTRYVEYTPGDDGAEASNVEASLGALGHAVTTFTGITAEDFRLALIGKRILVIPEQEIRALRLDLSTGAIGVIRDFVSSGGGTHRPRQRFFD